MSGPKPTPKNKFKDLLENPEVKAFLHTIRYGESSLDDEAYYMRVGGGYFSDLSKKPNVYVKDFNSTAEGAYQFNKETWDEASKALGLNDFSKESQDLAALWLIDKEKALDDVKKGDFEKAITKTANRWASFPTEKGVSYYEGQKAKNIEELKYKATYLKNVFKRHKMNEKGNEQERERIKKEFYKKYDHINSLNVSAIAKKQMVDDLKQEAFNDGILDIINSGIRYSNAKAEKFNKEFPKWEDLDKVNPNALTKSWRGIGYTKDTWNVQREYMAKNNWQTFEGKGVSTKDTPMDTKPFFELPGYVPKEEDFPEEETVPDAESKDNGNGSGNSGERPSVDFNGNKPKPWNDTDLLTAYMGQETGITDPQFEYKPGKQKVPYEAAISAASAILGVQAGNTEVPMRDEVVNEALLNHAADLKKVALMGLAPELEAEYTNKINSAYSVGLSNIVRASAGNRNLVLGNQGQLEEARIKGITDIALADLNVRDKAMADYGHVLELFNNFDATRDIANHDIKYREAEKKQMAGAALAEKGMTSLLQNIQYQRENGPGSANDMMRQWLMFHISGVNPNIKDDGTGKPGTPSYAAAVAKKKQERESNIQKAQDFVLNLKPEEKQKFDKWRKDNRKFDPTVNYDNFNADDMIEQWNRETGVVEGKDSFNSVAQTGDGSILLTPEQIADDRPDGGTLWGKDGTLTPENQGLHQSDSYVHTFHSGDAAGSDYKSSYERELEKKAATPDIVTINGRSDKEIANQLSAQDDLEEVRAKKKYPEWNSYSEARKRAIREEERNNPVPGIIDKTNQSLYHLLHGSEEVVDESYKTNDEIDQMTKDAESFVKNPRSILTPK